MSASQKNFNIHINLIPAEEQEITAVTSSLNGVLQGGRVIFLYKDGVPSPVRLKVIVNADRLLAGKSI